MMSRTVAKYDFSGKTVLVLGRSKGIGLGLVTEFSESGANVYYLSRTPNIKKIGTHIEVDLLDQNSLSVILEEIEKLEVNILVNCGAINFAHPQAPKETDTFRPKLHELDAYVTRVNEIKKIDAI